MPTDKKKKKQPDHSMHEDETVDPIPVEDHRQEIKEEKKKEKSKDDSSSERKYRKGE